MARKILVAGDFHGNLTHALRVMHTAEAEGYDTIVQIGDFGWWPPRDEFDGDNFFPRDVENILRELGIDMFFIDGNHENFEDLFSRPHTIDDQGFWQFFCDRPDSPNKERVLKFERLRYIPRGLVWEWDGIKFMGFGGAYSIDKYMRTEGVSWFKDEMPDYMTVAKALENAEKVDVMFSHDSPELPPRMNGQGYKEDNMSMFSRRTTAVLVEAYQPRVVYHGHYHERVDYEWFDQEHYNYVRIIGLGADIDGMNFSTVAFMPLGSKR